MIDNNEINLINKLLRKQLVQKFGVVFVGLFVIGAVAYMGTSLKDSSQAATGGTLYVTPASSANGVPGSNVTVTLRASTGTNPTNVVQAAVKYDPAKLQYVSIADSSVFPTVAATDTATPGLLRIARGTLPGKTVTGDNVVATVTFKVLASGSTSVSFDQAASMIIYSVDNTNMLSTVTGGQYSFGAQLALAPPTATYSNGASIAVAVNVDSGTELINTVQAAITYDPAQLQFVSVTEGTAFTTVAATDTATPGLIRLARGKQTSLSGNNLMTTINFKVIAGTGTARVAVDVPNSYVVRTSDNVNILSFGKNSLLTLTTASSVISAVSPMISPVSGGTRVTITGTNFVSGTTIRFGTASATSVVFVSSTSLTAVTPPNPLGWSTITLTTPTGQTVQFSGFKYVPNPGDVNNDGRVNAIDLSILISKDGQNYPQADFNGDGTVGAADMAIMLSKWTW